MQDIERTQPRKKVCFVVTKGVWGGAGRYVYDLATHLPKEHFEAVVIIGQGEALPEKLTKAGIRTIRLPKLKRDFSFFSAVTIGLKTLAILRTEKPDVLHLNSAKASGVGAVAGRITGVRKIIYTVHGFAFNEDRNIFSKVIIWFFTWLTMMLCHTVIVINKKEKAQALAMPLIGQKKVVLIHNGIGPIEFGDGEIIRNAFPTDAKITGTVGELTANKNQIALIEEARQKPDMYVAIVGEGELRKELQKKIADYKLQDNVKLFGFMPAENVLKGFDVFALPSKKEGLPYVLLEARQAGLPIVASRVGGVPDILDAPDMSEFTLDKMLEKTFRLYEK